MQIVKYIDLFIGALINLLFYLYVVKKVFDLKLIKNKSKIILSLLYTSLFVALINYLNKDIFKVLLTFPFGVILFRNTFNVNYKKSIFYLITVTLYSFIGEILAGLILSILPFDSKILFDNILGTTIGAFIICITTLPILKIKKLNSFFKKMDLEISGIKNLIITFIIIILIGALTYKNLFNKDLITTVMNIITTIFFIIMIYMYYRENTASKELLEKYNGMFEYIEKYEKELNEKRKIIHDYKNQLIIINGYIGNNQKLKEYVSELIEEQRHVNEISIIKDIDKLPSGLKGLIYYKFSHINNNIIVKLNVKTSLNKFCKLSPKLNRKVLTIIGILVDNAIEALEKEDNKLIEIDFSIVKSIFKMIIKNTNTKNININNIIKEGYSTKGKNRGYGLDIARDIVSPEENKLKLNISTFEDVFISELIVKI